MAAGEHKKTGSPGTPLVGPSGPGTPLVGPSGPGTPLVGPRDPGKAKLEIELDEAVARSMSEGAVRELAERDEPAPAQQPAKAREPVEVDASAAKNRARRDDDTGDAPRVTVVGIWRRVLAGAVDLACVSPVLLLAGWLALRVARLPIGERFGPETLIELLLWGGVPFYGTLALCIGIALLYALIFVSLTGRTPGLRLLGARVIDVYGDRPHLWRVFLRCVGMLASVALAGLGLLWIGFDREKRGLHDWIAGTYVIRSRAPSASPRHIVVGNNATAATQS